MAKCVSRKICSSTGETVFVQSAQTVAVSRENAFAYDGSASEPTYYNYYRDYDPAIGRYVQSDPIGLAGGLNTYTYADNAPTMKTDPLGLATYMCTRNLSNVPFSFGPLYHQYICVPDGKGGQTCGGLGPSGKMFDSPGVIEYEKTSSPSSCEKAADDNSCIEKCIQDEFKKPPPNYSVNLSQGQNCQTWANSAVSSCQAQCRGKK